MAKRQAVTTVGQPPWGATAASPHGSDCGSIKECTAGAADGLMSGGQARRPKCVDKKRIQVTWSASLW
jgi:hypothetical protein